MEIVLVIFFIFIFSIIILKWKFFSDSRVHPYLFVFLFLIKIGAGIFGGELYEHRYSGGDTHAFVNNSKVITGSFLKNPLDFFLMVSGIGNDKLFMEKYGEVISWDNEDVVYNDNRTILRLNAVIGLVSMGIYNVHVIFFSFLSMIGLMGIFKGTRLITQYNPYLLIAAIFLIPGVIFWLSVASKESILIFALGMLFYHCMKLLTISNSIVNILGMFLAGFLFIHIKAYVLVLITPCLIAFAWVSVTNNKNAILKYLSIYFVFAFLFFNLKYISDGFDPVNIIFMKRMNFEAFATAAPEDMKSYIEIDDFTSEWPSMLSVSPSAIANVFTRPYLWESESLLITFAAIENIILMLILFSGLIYFNINAVKKNINYLLFCLFFVLSVYLLIGLTTPVMGAMVRYKVPVLPFLCLLPILFTKGIDNEIETLNEKPVDIT